MQKKTKRIILICNFTLIIAFLAVIFSYVYFSLTDDLTHKLITEKPVKFALTVYGTENFMPDKLDVFYITFERSSKLLKILSVNTDMVVFRKKAKARSLKYSFFSTAKTDLNLALVNMHQDIFEMINNSFVSDYYVNISYETFLKLAHNDEELKKLLSEESFANRDAECVNRIDAAEATLAYLKNNTVTAIKSFRNNYNLIDTNISKLSFTNMAAYFKTAQADIMFFDMPAKYTKTRVEPDKTNITDMMYMAYYPKTDKYSQGRGGVIEVKNASQKPRMAEKATWKIREGKFDVLDWSNSQIVYNKTVVRNYKANYGAALQIVKILGCGKIINSYNAQTYYEMGVLIGKDCEIYDKLDKNGGANANEKQ